MPQAIPITRLGVRSTRLICSSIRVGTIFICRIPFVMRCRVGVVMVTTTDRLGGYRSQQRPPRARSWPTNSDLPRLWDQGVGIEHELRSQRVAVALAAPDGGAER